MENKNIFTNLTEMQKQAAETFATAAENMQKTFTNGNAVNFDSEFFKKWYDSQMAWFNQNNTTETNPLNFFNNWMTTQMNNAKQWSEMGKNPLFNANMFGTDANAMNNMMGVYTNWMNTITNSYSEMYKNMSNGNGKNAFEGMFNNSEMYLKAFELWMPVLKQLNDKTFTPESFKEMFNTSLYKDMMDKLFNMQPDYMQNMFNNPMFADMKNNMGNMMDSNKSAFENMKNMFNQNMPNGATMSNNMLDQYNTWYKNVTAAVAPLTKLMPNSNQKEQMETMLDIANQMAVYNLKNTQMQYVMYNTGLKAVDELAEELYTEMRKGESVEDFSKIYKNFLNKIDTHFVNLFETKEYSKMMAETSAMQLRLKKQMEGVMEKSLNFLPLINRTEMDDLYKTIYELKKRVNSLEKQLDTEETVAEVKEAKTAAKAETKIEVKDSKTAAKKTAKNA